MGLQMNGIKMNYIKYCITKRKRRAYEILYMVVRNAKLYIYMHTYNVYVHLQSFTYMHMYKCEYIYTKIVTGAQRIVARVVSSGAPLGTGQIHQNRSKSIENSPKSLRISQERAKTTKITPNQSKSIQVDRNRSKLVPS